MRQNNKNNRSRGRGRKGPNPLSRSYESNGPDVKVRGTAQHVAEKYLTLARDALSSGDVVVAENYFQHAEHYNRIIMSAQAQQNAAREEERKNREASLQENENNEQSATEEKPDVDADVSSSAPEGEGQNAVNEAESKPRSEDDEAPKKRRRRVSRPRRAEASEEAPSSDKADKEASFKEPSDMLADNPPAFLMSE